MSQSVSFLKRTYGATKAHDRETSRRYLCGEKLPAPDDSNQAGLTHVSVLLARMFCTTCLACPIESKGEVR